MFDILLNLFPIKAKSFEDFVRLALEAGCSSVNVEPAEDCDGGSSFTPVGRIGEFKHLLRYSALTPRGRKIVYREEVSTRFGSSSGFADADKRGKATMKLLLRGEQRMKELQAMLPKSNVRLMTPTGEFDETLFARLHADTARLGISI